MIPNHFATNDWIDLRKTQARDLANNPVISSSLQAILSRSILAAHLLIGDITEAENVVMEAIAGWEPDGDDWEQLFQSTLRAAVRRPITLFSIGLMEDGATDWKLPIELQRVLKLPPELRLSFILRVLIGLPAQVCAQMLGLCVHEVSEYSCAAMERLSVLDR